MNLILAKTASSECNRVFIQLICNIDQGIIGSAVDFYRSICPS